MTYIVFCEQPRCQRCGRFVRDVRVLYRMFGGEPAAVLRIEGTCKRHGVMDVDTDFVWAAEAS